MFTDAEFLNNLDIFIFGNIFGFMLYQLYTEFRFSRMKKDKQYICTYNGSTITLKEVIDVRDNNNQQDKGN